MNGWFPHISYSGDICSGNAGVWITPLNQPSYQYDVQGYGPIWIGEELVYNLMNNTTKVGIGVVPIAYNYYRGSDDNRWAGNSGPHTDFYNGDKIAFSKDDAFQAQFCTSQYSYLNSYFAFPRTLFINDQPIVTEDINAYTMADGVLVWQIATGTYTRALHTFDSNRQIVDVTIDGSEAPLNGFLVDGQPWILTQTGIAGGVLFVRPVFGYMGYPLLGIRMYAEGRMINGKLLVAASDDHGNQVLAWVDFAQPRTDLRGYGSQVPPEPEQPPVDKPPIPPEPEPEPPIPPKPVSDYYKVRLYGA